MSNEVIEHESETKLDHGDEFVYTKGVYMIKKSPTCDKRIKTRVWEMDVYRHGLKMYDVKVANGGVYLHITNIYARLEPILRFIAMILLSNKNNKSCTSVLGNYEYCEGDKCTYGMCKFSIFAEYNNPQGLLKYTHPVTKKRRSVVINIRKIYVPLLAEMAINKYVLMRRVERPSRGPLKTTLGPVKAPGNGPKTITNRCTCGAQDCPVDNQKGYQFIDSDTMVKLKEVSGMIIDHTNKMKKLGISERDTFDPKYINGEFKDTVVSKLSELSKAIKAKV
jgi:hypothetical protein